MQLFEQSKFANEIGAAVGLGPNASRVMASYGYSEERLGGVPCQYVCIFPCPDGVEWPLRVYIDRDSGLRWHGAAFD